MDDLRPTFIGWRGIVTDDSSKPVGWKPDGRRYEVATSAYPLYAGVRAAIAIHQQWGTAQERYEQICQGSQFLWERLSQLQDVRPLATSPPQAGLVSFVLTNGQSHKKLVRSLEEQDFMLRTLGDPNCVRACIHYFTHQEEMEELVEAIAKFIR
jgi:L-cysteine/cystine lyase